MKVGIYLGGQSPDSGGGYTFQADLFAAFASLASSSRHEFVVFIGENLAGAAWALLAGTGVNVIPMPRAGMFSRFAAMLQRDFSFVRVKWRHAGRLQQLASQHAIEYMWFLSSDCHLLDIPYMAVVWDLQHRTLPWFPEVTANGEFDAREASNGWFLRRASAVVTGTRVGASELERYYQITPGCIKILPHPTPAYALAAASDPAGEESAVRIRRAYRIGVDYVVYPAQFWAHKNHANLLHAMAILGTDRRRPIDLVMVGSDKGNRAYCESLAAKLGLTGTCHFLGFIPREDLIDLYRAAVALVYPSFGGPENLPPLEAFALGCPVLAADVPGAREQLGECAKFIDPRNPAQIAGAIDALCNDVAARASMIEQGKARASAWTGKDFIKGVFGVLDEFEPVRRAWGLE